ASNDRYPRRHGAAGDRRPLPQDHPGNAGGVRPRSSARRHRRRPDHSRSFGGAARRGSRPPPKIAGERAAARSGQRRFHRDAVQYGACVPAGTPPAAD
ncbi:MAG: Aspartate racemase, partial [uncultured Thermomicrobiales bacterium]